MTERPWMTDPDLFPLDDLGHLLCTYDTMGDCECITLPERLAAHDARIRADMLGSIVHTVEIRRDADDDWSLCDVYAHPVVESVPATIADLTNRLRDAQESFGHSVSGTSTRELSGLLVKTETLLAKSEKTYEFRHTIQAAKRSAGEWLKLAVIDKPAQEAGK